MNQGSKIAGTDPRNDSTSVISGVDSIINTNHEILSALEKQTEILGARLEPVRCSSPDVQDSDSVAVTPAASILSKRLFEETYRLRALSDTISRIIRELDI